MPSTANLAGASAAIEKRLTDNWPQTLVIFENTDPPADWPRTDADGVPQPWVYCELVDVNAAIIGFGTPGNQTVMDDGLIKMHVMVQKGSGLDDGRAKAVALGEIFRQKTFYTDDPTAYVRTLTPRVGPGMESDDGNWVGIACTVPYEFYHRA